MNAFTILWIAFKNSLACTLGFHQWVCWRDRRMCALAGCQKLQVLNPNGKWRTVPNE